jgi:hypothetical protein
MDFVGFLNGNLTATDVIVITAGLNIITQSLPTLRPGMPLWYEFVFRLFHMLSQNWRVVAKGLEPQRRRIR